MRKLLFPALCALFLVPAPQADAPAYAPAFIDAVKAQTGFRYVKP